MLDRVSIEKINHPKYRNIFIGLSGGVDSVVMLDLVHKNCGKPIFAIHVNHDFTRPAFSTSIISNWVIRPASGSSQ